MNDIDILEWVKIIVTFILGFIVIKSLLEYAGLKFSDEVIYKCCKEGVICLN